MVNDPKLSKEQVIHLMKLENVDFDLFQFEGKDVNESFLQEIE